MHSIPPLTQLEHGDLLLHRIFLRRQVKQLRKIVDSCTASEVSLGFALGAAVGGLDAVGRVVNEDFSSEGSRTGEEPLGVKDMTKG